jgi:hypothetical protein
MLAAAGGGYKLVGWGARPPTEARLVWQFDTLATTAGKLISEQNGDSMPDVVKVDALSRGVAEQAVFSSLNGLRARREPAAWRMLHDAIYASLAESGLLAQIAALSPDDVADPLTWLTETIRSTLDGAPLRQITSEQASQPLWWLDAALEPEAALPLSDRVELAVAEILRDLLAVTELELDRRVCARFPGFQTPDARLVQLCLFSYGDEHAPGHWRLRAEDDLEARVAETDAVINDLSSLGQRLGFEVVLGAPRAGEWAVRWLDETGQTPYAFAVRTTAVLGDLIFDLPHPPTSTVAPETHRSDAEATTIPCITVPGGRAVLVDYKLRHDPRLHQQVRSHDLQFLKFRHLRHLVQEVAAKQLDRFAFQAALGLDPIVEQGEAQLSLW